MIKQNFNDKRISIINQENEGLSSARNTGLHHANGEYIWFFDSDDWISNNALKDIINQLSSCDILYFKSYYMERENNTTIYSLSNKENIGINFVKKRFHHGAPFYIYKKKMLINDNLYFEKGIYHEDTLFTPQTLFKCQSVKQYDIPSDGLVLTFDDTEYGISLGMTNKFPKHSIAFKWKDETVEPKLLNIDWQIL